MNKNNSKNFVSCLWSWILFIVFFSFFVGCNGVTGGTETGNPGIFSSGNGTTTSTEDSDSTGPNSSSVGPAMTIISDLCVEANACDGAVDVEDCEQNLNVDTVLIQDLGLSPNAYPTIDSVDVAVDNGSLELNTSVFQICLESIQELVCSEINSNAVGRSLPEDCKP